MIHIMKLKEQYFNCIKDGSKKYEIRLNDEKRQLIKVGDFIEFQKEPELEEKLIVKVEELLYFNNFNELLNTLDISLLAPSNISKEDLNNDLNRFYPIDKQEQFGVLAINLNKDIIINNTNINTIDYNDSIFDTFKNNYSDFNSWFNKMKEQNIDVYYTKKDNQLSSIMILKINEKDSLQFNKEGNILKLRSFIVKDKNKGIGKLYLDIMNEIAISNNIDYIYLTVKETNNELISFIEKNGFIKYGIYNDEYVYYKEL